MSDKETNQRSEPQAPGLEGAIVFKTESERLKEEEAEEKRRANRYHRDQTLFSGVLTAATIVTAAVASYQGCLLREYTRLTKISAEAAKSAAETASHTLEEIKKGGSDTHELALAAKKQADITVNLAAAGVDQVKKLEAGVHETHALARAAQDQANATIEQARIGARSLEASQRPWISADISIAGPFVPDENGAHVTVNVAIKNTGLSTAIGLEYNVELYTMNQGKPGPVDERARFCNETMHRPPSQEALFSGANIVQQWQIGISKEDIDKFAIQVTVPPFDKLVPTDMIACIAYRSLIVSGTFYTGYIYNLVTDQGALRYPGPTSADHLRLVSQPQFGAVIAR